MCNFGMNQFLNGCTPTVEEVRKKGKEGRGGGRVRQFSCSGPGSVYCQICTLHNCVTKKTLSRNVFLVESVSTCTT